MDLAAPLRNLQLCNSQPPGPELALAAEARPFGLPKEVGGNERARARVRLGFLDPFSLAHESRRSRLLDVLGFPWILSSESGLINGLCAILRGKKFRSPFPCMTRRRNASRRSRPMRMAGNVHEPTCHSEKPYHVQSRPVKNLSLLPVGRPSTERLHRHRKWPERTHQANTA
jgi:hypothetical protein